jgi:hypothetical protein
MKTVKNATSGSTSRKDRRSATFHGSVGTAQVGGSGNANRNVDRFAPTTGAPSSRRPGRPPRGTVSALDVRDTPDACYACAPHGLPALTYDEALHHAVHVHRVPRPIAMEALARAARETNGIHAGVSR